MVTLDQAGWNRGRATIHVAPPHLADFVQLLWVDDRARHSPRAHEWRVVADDAPHLIYSRTQRGDAPIRHRIAIVGSRTRHIDVNATERLLTVGARLHPGALPSVFNIPAQQLTDLSLSLTDVVRHPVSGVLDALASAAANELLPRLLGLLDGIVRRARPLDCRARVLRTLEASRHHAIGDIAHALGIGDRALRSWSADHLGVGPRTYFRIRRLHSAIEGRLRNPNSSWSRIAAACGYADQPHLVRDCRALLGESPTSFLARAS